MKTYNDLTSNQQQMAVQARINWLLERIVEGSLTFSDESMQFRVKQGLDKADSMRTPWFAASYVMDEIGPELRNLAEQEVKQMIFIEPHESAMTEPEAPN